VSNPGRLCKGISCDVDKFLEAHRLSSEISQLVMPLGGKALSSYYGPYGIVKYGVEDVRY
jgi:hypothetical protein